MEVTSGKLRLSIDPDRCAGHGRCFALEPDLFDCDDQGHGVLLHETVPPGAEENAKNAVGNCPEQAISLTSSPGMQ